MMNSEARELETLEILDTLVQQASVRRELDSIADGLVARLTESSEPLVWQPIHLSLYGVPVPLGATRNPVELGVRAEAKHDLRSRATSEQHPEGDVLSGIGRSADPAGGAVDPE